MRQTLTVTLSVGALLGLSACASSDHVLFVTKTSIGIDFDSKPANASLAYDRVEGYVAPRYANGEIPPVVASVKSDGKIFNPKVQQVYATGDAAVIATGGKVAARNLPLKGARELMFFGTTTTTGIKVGFTTGLPDSFVFGFKRKEFSYIPLATVDVNDKARDVYPSVLASIDTAANVSTGGTTGDTSLTNSQFFATGRAARLLANNPQIKDRFTAIARDAILMQQAKAVQGAQIEADSADGLADRILESFNDPDTTAAQRGAIVAAAQAAGMDPGKFMTVDNFPKELSKFSSTPQALPKLQALQKQVDALFQP